MTLARFHADKIEQTALALLTSGSDSDDPAPKSPVDDVLNSALRESLGRCDSSRHAVNKNTFKQQRASGAKVPPKPIDTADDKDSAGSKEKSRRDVSGTRSSEEVVKQARSSLPKRRETNYDPAAAADNGSLARRGYRSSFPEVGVVAAAVKKFLSNPKKHENMQLRTVRRRLKRSPRSSKVVATPDNGANSAAVTTQRPSEDNSSSALHETAEDSAVASKATPSTEPGCAAGASDAEGLPTSFIGEPTSDLDGPQDTTEQAGPSAEDDAGDVIDDNTSTGNSTTDATNDATTDDATTDDATNDATNNVAGDKIIIEPALADNTSTGGISKYNTPTTDDTTNTAPDSDLTKNTKPDNTSAAETEVTGNTHNSTTTTDTAPVSSAPLVATQSGSVDDSEFASAAASLISAKPNDDAPHGDKSAHNSDHLEHLRHLEELEAAKAAAAEAADVAAKAAAEAVAAARAAQAARAAALEAEQAIAKLRKSEPTLNPEPTQSLEPTHRPSAVPLPVPTLTADTPTQQQSSINDGPARNPVPRLQPSGSAECAVPDVDDTPYSPVERSHHQHPSTLGHGALSVSLPASAPTGAVRRRIWSGRSTAPDEHFSVPDSTATPSSTQYTLDKPATSSRRWDSPPQTSMPKFVPTRRSLISSDFSFAPRRSVGADDLLINDTALEVSEVLRSQVISTTDSVLTSGAIMCAVGGQTCFVVVLESREPEKSTLLERCGSIVCKIVCVCGWLLLLLLWL